MNNFDWTQFSKCIFINKYINSVYAAWTVSAEIEKWFLSKCIFVSKDGNEINSTDSVCSKHYYRWRWFAQNHYEEGSVISANGVDLIEFSFAGNCKVQVKLSSLNNQTLVELTQTEIPADDNSKQNIRLGCAFGWTFYLLNLKSILEGGIDLRNKDTKIIGVVNN